MPAIPWRAGVRCDVTSDGPAVVLDPARARLLHLTGAAAALARGEATPRRDDVLANLRALGLLDATGEPARRLAPDRRRVLTAGSAAALGISVLMLPGAAEAASVDLGWTASAADPLALELARAVLADPNVDAEAAYLAGGLDGEAAIARLDRDTGVRGPALVIAGTESAGTCYPVDMVRIGDRVYVLVIVAAARFADAALPYQNSYYSSRIVEVVLGATGEGSVDGLALGRSADIEAHLGEGSLVFPGCLLTDGSRLHLAGVVMPAEPAEGEGGAGGTFLVEILLGDGALILGVGDPLVEAAAPQELFLPLAGVVADGVAVVWLQTPDHGPETATPEALGVLARVDLGDPGEAAVVLGIGPTLPIFALTASQLALPQRAAPVLFAGSAYVATVARPEAPSDPAPIVIARFDLGDPGLWGSGGPGDATEVLVLPTELDAPVLTLGLRGDRLVVSTFTDVIVVPLAAGGALPPAQDVEVLPLDGPEGIVSDPATGQFDPFRAGLAPMIPTTRVARAFFGTGKGKGELVEVTV